jgi:alkanesulfonate monooxygenase SsuD/methylene tetrahydromethanopterin reductase-like flavin-dependent oxidoreductase (luciferase family)
MNDSVLTALGLAVLPPGQCVNATRDALEVIRGLWSEAEFSYTSEYFRLERGRLEPRPERSIPVWLGAYGPRMLELTGRLADGWIPSLFVLGPDQAYAVLDRVRRSAWDAGRDPDRLTYAYNVSVLIDSNATSTPGQVSGAPADVAEKLADFVQHGFTSLNFWLLKNTPDQLERLAADVLPRVRDHLV